MIIAKGRKQQWPEWFRQRAAICLTLFSLSASTGASGAARGDPGRPPEAPKPLTVHFIDVGHGDSCLIRCPGGENILIDGGPGYSWAMGEQEDVVNRYLRGLGVKTLDLVIATHPHSDHVGGLASVLYEFPARMVLDSGKAHTTKSYQWFLDAVKANPKTKYKLGRAGQVYRFGNVKLSILSPTDPLPGEINDCSIVCRLEYGRASFLFMGDAQKKAEKEIMRRRYRLRSSVLKVGHHGNASSSAKPFLRTVRPRVAVISCATRKSLNNGSSSVVDKLKRCGASVYRTDERGTIIVETDGKGLRVKVRGKE